MANRETAGRASRDPRLYRHNDSYGPGNRPPFRNEGGQGFNAQAFGRPGPRPLSYREYGAHVDERNRETLVRQEQFDYGHGRDRSRSPYGHRSSITESDVRGKPACDVKTLLRDESIQITVGNDKFKSQTSGLAQNAEIGSRNAGSLGQTISAAARRPPSSDQHDYSEETASVARAKEMAMRTREMLSKLSGWNPIRLQPQEQVQTGTTERPSIVNVSNSAYTKLSASSEVAQTILRNINAVAAAFCPKESGGVAHFKCTNPPRLRKSNDDDEEKFLYGEEVGLKNSEQRTVQRSATSREVQPAIPGHASLAETLTKKSGVEGDCDPIVANVLKSIGFNFELSKLMQEKAKKEREENEKNHLLIQQASSFLAKQLGKSDMHDTGLQEPNPLERLTRVVVNEGARASKALSRSGLRGQAGESGVLYDDFSNSEDEFNESERGKKVWQNPPDVPLMHPGIPPPTVVLPMSTSVLPPPVTMPPSVLLPPGVIPPSVVPPMPQQPVWPVYQVQDTSSMSKLKPAANRNNEVEWEQNTEDFLRKLQTPRLLEMPGKSETQSKSPLEGLLETSREASRSRKRQTPDGEPPKSPERNTKKRKLDHRKSDDRHDDDNDSLNRQLSSLRDELLEVKKQHSDLMSIGQRSTNVREKLARNRYQQNKLNDEITSVMKKIRFGNPGQSAVASDEESSYDRRRDRRRTSSRADNSSRHSRELSRERDRDASIERRRRSPRPRRGRRSRDRSESLSSTSTERSRRSPARRNAETKANRNKRDATESRQKDESRRRADKDVKKEKRAADADSGSDSVKVKKSKIRYDFYDGGVNWCSECNTVFAKLSEYCEHLHSESHKKILNRRALVMSRPWATVSTSPSKPHDSVPPISKPAAGMEFLTAVNGFYCSICKAFSGDSRDAERHVLSEEHNQAYKQYCSDNPNYLTKYNMIKFAKISIINMTKKVNQPEPGDDKGDAQGSCQKTSENDNLGDAAEIKQEDETPDVKCDLTEKLYMDKKTEGNFEETDIVDCADDLPQTAVTIQRSNVPDEIAPCPSGAAEPLAEMETGFESEAKSVHLGTETGEEPVEKEPGDGDVGTGKPECKEDNDYSKSELLEFTDSDSEICHTSSEGKVLTLDAHSLVPYDENDDVAERSDDGCEQETTAETPVSLEQQLAEEPETSKEPANKALVVIMDEPKISTSGESEQPQLNDMLVMDSGHQEEKASAIHKTSDPLPIVCAEGDTSINQSVELDAEETAMLAEPSELDSVDTEELEIFVEPSIPDEEEPEASVEKEKLEMSAEPSEMEEEEQGTSVELSVEKTELENIKPLLAFSPVEREVLADGGKESIVCDSLEQPSLETATESTNLQLEISPEPNDVENHLSLGDNITIILSDDEYISPPVTDTTFAKQAESLAPSLSKTDENEERSPNMDAGICVVSEKNVSDVIQRVFPAPDSSSIVTGLDTPDSGGLSEDAGSGEQIHVVLDDTSNSEQENELVHVSGCVTGQNLLAASVSSVHEEREREVDAYPGIRSDEDINKP